MSSSPIASTSGACCTRSGISPHGCRGRTAREGGTAGAGFAALARRAGNTQVLALTDHDRLSDVAKKATGNRVRVQIRQLDLMDEDGLHDRVDPLALDDLKQLGRGPARVLVASGGFPLLNG